MELLLDELVDVAQLVVRSGASRLSCSAVLGQPVETVSSRWVDGSPAALDEAMHRGLVEEVVVPSGGPPRRKVLASLLVDPALVDEVDELGAERLLVLPLTARGRCFGALVLARARGFGFSSSSAFLDDLAERVAVGLDATLVVAESRHVASVLRHSLAPIEMPEVPGLELASHYRVADQSEQVSGDFFDVHGPADDVVLLCGDVAGKGVEASVAAKRIRNAVRTASLVRREPGWILGLVNRVLVDEAEEFSERLATATCVRLRRDRDGLVAEGANAGHPAALLLRTDGGLEEVQAPGVALALVDGSEYAETRVRLRAGDLLLLYTDGVTEARGADGLFGEERLRATVRGLADVPARDVVDAVAEAVSDHLGDRPHDDIAVLAVRCGPEPV